MVSRLKFGVGSSAFQQGSFKEFGPSNWTHDADLGNVPKTTIQESFWETIGIDIAKMARMGLKVYRVSIERSYVEPNLGEYNEAALARYETLVDKCHEHGIEVMFTLHHFTHPMYAKIGFENEENIQPFVAYCSYVFNRFSNKVASWCTLNEPGVEAFSGYLLGQFPPHNHLNRPKAIRTLKHMMQAHMEVYHTLKSLPNGNTASIGIVHNILRFKALYNFDWLSTSLTNAATKYTDDLIMDFLSTGTFQHPDYPQFTYEDLRKKGDYFGLNFYANPTLGPNLTNVYGATCASNQVMGDMYLPIDPEGFADAIDRAAQLNLPIDITETGIADEKDTIRPKFLIDYLRVVINKLEAGVEIRKFILWTFKDNYEWNEGNRKMFGLFDAHDKPRASAHYYERLVKEMTRILNNEDLDNQTIIDLLRKTLNQVEQDIKKTDLSQSEIGTYQT